MRFFGGLYLHLGKVEQDWNSPYGPRRHISSPTLQPGQTGPLALAGACAVAAPAETLSDLSSADAGCVIARPLLSQGATTPSTINSCRKDERRPATVNIATLRLALVSAT